MKKSKQIRTVQKIDIRADGFPQQLRAIHSSN